MNDNNIDAHYSTLNHCSYSNCFSWSLVSPLPSSPDSVNDLIYAAVFFFFLVFGGKVAACSNAGDFL